MKLDATTLLCATIAHPNRATKTPIMHNAGLKELGLNFVYLAFEPEDLQGALTGMRALEIRGFSVSKPYKETILPLLDELDPVAERIGAVNTVLNNDGHLKGFNSDWIGAAEAIKEKGKLTGAKVALLGAGGAARAVAYGLKQEGATITLFNRTVERAARLAADLEVDFGGSLSELDAIAANNVIINATSVGFHPDVTNSPIPDSALDSNHLLLDLVFNPKETKLLKQAQDQGCEIVYGTRMLVLQGAFQFKLFTGADAPVDVMQEALEASFRETT
jgi:shikimate dehydrogenase